jgi:YVTN family beta-propeller protein
MNHPLFTPIAAPVRTTLYLIISVFVFGLSQTVLAQGWGRPTHSSRIALSLGDKLLWVVNPGDDSVSALRTDTYAVLAKIPVGREPRGVALTPDNQFVYVANALGDSVTVIKIGNATWAGFQADVYFTAGVQGHITTGAGAAR